MLLPPPGGSSDGEQPSADDAGVVAQLGRHQRRAGVEAVEELVVALRDTAATLLRLMALYTLANAAKLVLGGAQFIIATHSPILMAYPHATLYHLDDSGLAEVAFTDTDHFAI